MTAERTEAAITTSHNDKSPASVHKLLFQVASVYDIKDLVEQLNEASASDWTRASLIRQIKGPVNECRLNEEEYCYLRSLLPSRPVDYDQKFFRFIDRLFILLDVLPLVNCWMLKLITVTSFLQSSGNTSITTPKSIRQKVMDLALGWLTLQINRLFVEPLVPGITKMPVKFC